MKFLKKELQNPKTTPVSTERSTTAFALEKMIMTKENFYN